MINRVAFALAMSIVAGSAMARPYNPDRLPPDQLAEVGRACETVIVVKAGTPQYDSCFASLSRSARRFDEARAVTQAHMACLSEGLLPATADLALCELRAAKATPASAGATSPGPGGAAVRPGPYRSFFHVSAREIRRREQAACARLGFDPADGFFAGCVANLDAALVAGDRPFTSDIRALGDSPFN